MRTQRIFGALASIVVLFGLQTGGLKAQSGPPSSSTSSTAATPPVKPVTDDYYGTKIVDTYRYMENLSDPEVQAWMKAQNDFTHTTLGAIPGRAQLLARIQQLDQSVPRVFAGRLPGDLYLIQKRLPNEDIYKLYARQGLSGEDKLLVDPEKVAVAAPNQGKGKNTIHYSVPSRDSKYVAVGIAPGGAERDTEIHVFEVASGRETGDVIFRSWGGGVSWLPDGHSFVYVKLQKLPPGAPVTEIEQKQRTYLHVLGEKDPENDPAVFGYGVVPEINVDPTFFASVSAQPDWNYALGSINNGVSPNSAFYIESVSDLGKTNSAWREVADFSDDVSDVEVHGDDLYVLTYKNALRYKVLRTDARHPDLASAETIVPPGQAVVTGINPAEDALYVQLLDGGIGRVLRIPYGSHPQAEEVALPFKGSAFVGTDPRLPGALLYLTSWTKAFKIYLYDPEKKQAINTKYSPWAPTTIPPTLSRSRLSKKLRRHRGPSVDHLPQGHEAGRIKSHSA